MSLWGRVKQRFARSAANDSGAGVYTLDANLDGWRSERRNRSGSDPHWSATAWDVYRNTPEVRAAIDWLTNAMSRVRLYPAWLPEDNGEPQPIEETAQTKALVDPVRELFGGPLQQAEMLRRWYLYRLVAGECIIAAVQPTIEERRRYAIMDDWLWMVRDATPVSTSATGVEVTLTWDTHRGAITRRFNTGQVPDDIVFVHDKVPDPVNPSVADSPTRTVMRDAELLEHVADAINATSVSRIAGVKMLAAKAGVTIPGFGGPAAPDDEDPVLAGLVDTMGQRVANRREPLVPLVFRTSDNESSIQDQLMPIDLTSSYDERTLDILDWVSRRVAITYSVPVEVCNGSADPNHWNALFNGQDGARIVLAPVAAEFCRVIDACWVQWQRVRRGVPIETVRRATIWYDTSALVQDPDRSATLIALRQVDPTLVTGQEVRRGVGLTGEPEDPDFAPPTAASPTEPAPRASRSASPRINGSQTAVPSIPGGRPVVRSPGFPERQRAGPRA